MQLANILEKPFTFTAHAYEIFSNKVHSDIRLNTLVKNAAQVITPSEFNKNFIIEKTGCDPDKIGIVRATIRTDKFSGLPKTNTDKTKIKIISVGRLVEKKGFEYLIRAMKKVTEKHPETFLNIIGDGELMTDLKKLSHELSLAKSINFFGAQPNEICMEELLSSDIAVLPCVVAQDGDMDVCPLTLQEAMAMGIPVISTKVGSVPELIINGKEGILVDQKNVNELADSIIKLINNFSLRDKLGKSGRKKIHGEFNIKKQVDKLMSLWNSVLGNKINTSEREKFDPYEYWSERSKKYGKIAVGNLSKPIEKFDEDSESVKNKLLPVFKTSLNSNVARLLDFGCGYGRFTTELAEFVDQEAWGIDATPELIELAEKEKTNPKTFFRTAKYPLPFDNEYFDVIWITYVFEHIMGDEKEKTAKELLRILKPGGLLFIVVNTVLSQKVKQCDIRSFNWYEEAFDPIKFEIRDHEDTKIVNRNKVEKLEKDRQRDKRDLVLILSGIKPMKSSQED